MNLYIGKYSDIKTKYNYYNGKYMLIFSDKKPKGEWKIIPPNNYKKLPFKERQWLITCKTDINNEHIKSNEQEYLKFFDDFLNTFEKEAKKEKRSEEKCRNKSHRHKIKLNGIDFLRGLMK